MVIAVDAVATFPAFTYGLLIAPRVSFCCNNADAPSKRLHPSLQGRKGRPSHCRVRIYLPEDMRDAPVVICSELPSNPGGSITNSAETIAAGVILASELPPLWVGSSTGPRRLQKYRRPSS
jgi:hypothetical protein